MRVVSIIPTYNEKENIKTLIEGLQKEFSKHPEHEWFILIVDDNSPDGTGDIVQEMMQKHSNLRLLRGQKIGLGVAYKRGIKYAIKKMDADVITSMDADLSHDPDYVPKLVDQIEDGADLVLGSRYIKGGSIPKDWGLHRKILSSLGNVIVRLLLGMPNVHEFTNSLRAYRADLYKKMDKSKFDFDDNTFLPAFIYEAHKKGADIREIPLQFKNRVHGESKIEVFTYTPNLLKFCLRKRLTQLL